MEIGWRNGRARTAVAMIGRATAQYTVVLWEHEPKLRDPSTQTGRLLYEVYFQAGIGQVERRPHTGNSAPYDQRRGGFGDTFTLRDHGKALFVDPSVAPVLLTPQSRLK